jgi:hypothetical protein
MLEFIKLTFQILIPDFENARVTWTLEDFPSLHQDDERAVLAFAAIRECRLDSVLLAGDISQCLIAEPEEPNPIFCSNGAPLEPSPMARDSNQESWMC